MIWPISTLGVIVIARGGDYASEKMSSHAQLSNIIHLRTQVVGQVGFIMNEPPFAVYLLFLLSLIYVV